MKFVIDIDNTICHTENSDYKNSKPRQEQIDKINKLHNEGHTIIYWTARGGHSGKDWSVLTQRQLDVWGCKYTRIETQKKPSWDLFIDDKTKRIEEI